VTEDIDTYVQTCLHDHGISPWKRARMAAEAIERYARAEEDLPPDVTLPVPLEWEHRVPRIAETAADAIAELDQRVRSAPLTSPVDLDHGVYEVTTVDEDAADLMREAFDAEWDGRDEAERQQAFDRFWHGDENNLP
jgi:hypothetical protein